MIDLEIKYSYQEQLIDELNQRIIEQQAMIDELTLRFQRLENQLKSDVDPGIIDISLEIPPPHY